jgi:porin
MALGVCATWGLAKNPDWTPFPKATWGGNIHLKATQAISFRIGAYEVNPRQGEPTGFYWSLAGSTGAIVPFELDYETGVGQSGLPGIIKIGGYFDTSRYDDWYAAINGAPLPLTTLPPATSRRTGFYFLAQQMLWRTGPEPGEGLTGLAGYVHNTASVSIFQNFAFVGLLDEGLVPGRPHDRAGLSFVYAGVSHNLNAVQTLEAELGLPLTNNAPGVQANEMLIEANYAIAAYRGINVMPDLQFIIHPSAAHTYPDALVVGLQIRAHF